MTYEEIVDLAEEMREKYGLNQKKKPDLVNS